MKNYLLLLVTLYFTSCDCYREATGTVVDAKTGLPLHGVTVYNKTKEWSKNITDSAGYFKLSAIAGGMNCPPLVVVFEMKDYVRTEFSFVSSIAQTIKLEQNK